MILVVSGLLLVDHLHALSDSETVALSLPLPGESSPVDESTKHPEGGSVVKPRPWRRLPPGEASRRKRERDCKYYHLNKSRAAQQSKDRYAKNKDSILAYHREHYRKNKARIIEYNQRLSEKIKREQPERYALWKKRSYENRKPKLPEIYAARRTPEYRKKHRVYSKKWDKAHPDRRAKLNRSWVQRNMHIVKANRIKRKAPPEYRDAVSSFVAAIRIKKSVKCYYCPTRVPGRKAHIDHIVPVSKGGLTIPSNLCASCPDCNLSKHARQLADWDLHPQTFLSL